MKKITILALHLGYGGIEKSITSLANGLANDYEVEVISTYKLFDTPAFFINEKIKVTYLMEKDRPNRTQFKEALRQHKIIKIIKEGIYSLKIICLRRYRMVAAIRRCESDIIISTRDFHNIWLGKYGNKRALRIGWEHNHPNNNNAYIKKVNVSSKNLNYMVFVSKEIRDIYQSSNKNTHCQYVYIPNSIDFVPKQSSPLKGKRIVAVGRLAKEKGFHDMIDLFKKLAELENDSNLHLDIIGDGELYTDLKMKIQECNLMNQITLHGYQSQEYIHRYLLQSTLYWMTSYTESFGIVLIDAFAYGVPCIAFTSAQGATEIITNDINGFLVESRNEDMFIEKTRDLLKDNSLLKEMGARAKDASYTYLIDNIKKQWIQLFEEKSKQEKEIL